VTDWSSQTTTSGYDAAGNLVSTVFPNGASTAYAYDAAGRLLNVTNRTGANVNSAYTYVMDKVGNRLEVASYNEGVERYGYDKLYRLTSWTSPSRQAVRYAYDPVGNRVSMAEPTGTVNYAYDAADELLAAGGTTFTYDGNGNQLTKTTAGVTLTYDWDALNRLLSVTGGSVNTQYQYDGDGNRVSQQTPAGTYAYANDTATPLPVVVNENGPDGNIDYAWGSSLISASATGLQSFYQFDGLGSVVAVTDGAASQKASYAYEPWGSVIGGSDQLGTKNKFKFTSEAVDPSANLTFLRGRYYDSNIGRFLGTDPAHGMSGANVQPYQYGRGNPLRYTDPLGRSSIDTSNDARVRALRVQLGQEEADSEYSGALDQIYGEAHDEVRDAFVSAEQGLLDIAEGNVSGAITSQAGSVNYVVQHMVKNGTVKRLANCATAATDIVSTATGLQENFQGSALYEAPSNILGFTQYATGASGTVSGCAK
jgi:RHS repeat-associated protein